MTLEGLWMLILLTFGLLGACIYTGLVMLLRRLRERWRIAIGRRQSIKSGRLRQPDASAGPYRSGRDKFRP
ncbi:hypothetical protein [Sphingomonas sp. MMS24-J13]|uniref:hypothetical protein n=1 Tax=Sphingomonas sp. MMS24-J13 TaxID=3238686 RepID=UPI003850C107